jgi:hypothetical protein
MSTPRFERVPEDWKHPLGPYRQAPAEYGGEWWLVNPFTTEEPWVTQSVVVDRELPSGFVEIFGVRPKISDFARAPNSAFAWRVAVDLWEQDLRYFKRAGVPEWATAQQVAAAEEVSRSWDLGPARYYEGRYGWMARFPESQIRSFESSAWGALNVTHHVVATFQWRLLERGIVPTKRHPFVPPQLWPDDEQASN